MERTKSRMSVLRKALVIMPIIIAIMFVSEIIYVNYFNRQEHVLNGAEETDRVSMTIAGKEGSTSTWMKRGYDLYGETVDLNAQTMDVDFINHSSYQIGSWQLKVNIKDDCLLNQAWCGKVEIHQHVNGDTKVQTLDLRNYSLNDVTLDYLFDGDLLIPLSEGDYVIYYPSEDDGEVPFTKNSQVTMGFILYYLEFPTQSTYEVTYTYDRKLMDGSEIYVILSLTAIWLIALMFFMVSDITYKNAVKEMEIKKSGILSLSDMYSIIYIIDLKTDTLMPVAADEESEKLRPKKLPASQQIRGMFEYDSSESYKEMALEFSDLSTIEKRLQEKSTVAFEYVSVNYGWCRIRFFAMDRMEGAPIEKVVFTIQNINEEKAEMEAIAHRVDEAEHESKAKSIFLANMSHEIRTPINTIIGLNTMILREAKEPKIKSYAKNINSASNMLLSLINGILDMSKIEADKMELVPEEYSFTQLLADVICMVRTRAEFNKLEFKYNVSEMIPDKLYGDKVRLKQVILNLITNAAKYTDEGGVELCVFGKNHDNKVHLLISVKDTGIGIKEEDLEKLSERFSRFDEKRNHSIEGTGIGLNLVNGILGLMGTELHVISKYGEGSEFYFEIEQEVIDETPIGQIDINEEEAGEEEYQALFIAPDARILVADDNMMNLMVFEELLKETKLQIDAVNSGFKALEMAQKQKYDLIFMDHMMPEMDGVETFRRIRKQETGLNTGTPVIVLTANAIKGASEEYRQIGFDDFLAKPIQPEVLERMILNYLDSSKVKENTAPVEKKEEKIIEEKLPAIAGVDTAFGAAHTGGVNAYISVLKQFVNMADADKKELQTYLENIGKNNMDSDAIRDYRIKVHAMKASANVMGAFQAYGIAAMLEKAADRENAKEILDVTPYFFEVWTELRKVITESLPETEKKKAKLSKEKVQSLLHLLETSMKSYDIKNADAIMEELQLSEWSEDATAVVEELKTAVAGLDAEKVTILCANLRKISEV